MKIFLLLSGFITTIFLQAQPCLPTVSYPITWEIEDNSGNGYDPTLVGGAHLVAGYLHIDYNDDAYLELPSEVLDSMGDFTVEFDFRLTDLNVTGSSPTNTIIAGSSSFEEGEFAISYEEASEAIIVALKGSGAVFEIALTNNVWYCLQMVRDGSIVTVYVDGVFVESNTMSDDLLEIEFLEIGQELDCVGGCFATNQCLNGDVDNFSIYPCVLTDANCQPYFAPCDTILLYPFDTNVNDYSGNENHGIVNGDANVDPGYLEIGYNDDDFIEIPVSALNGLTEFTISFNFKLNAFNTSGSAPTNTFIAGTKSGVEHEFALSYEKSSNAFEFAIHNVGGIIPAVINEGQWYCVSFLWENDTLSTILDGVYLPDYLVLPEDPIEVSLLEIGQEIDCISGCYAENQSLNGSMDNLIIMDCVENIECKMIQDGVWEVGMQNELVIYPNPVDEVLNINISPFNGNCIIAIFNINGQLIYSETKYLFGETPIMVNNLNTGLYELRITNYGTGKQIVTTFVKN